MPVVKISARLELNENISFMDGHELTIRDKSIRMLRQFAGYKLSGIYAYGKQLTGKTMPLVRVEFEHATPYIQHVTPYIQK